MAGEDEKGVEDKAEEDEEDADEAEEEDSWAVSVGCCPADEFGVGMATEVGFCH